MGACMELTFFEEVLTTVVLAVVLVLDFLTAFFCAVNKIGENTNNDSITYLVIAMF
jgi:hypothetical protein